jgi:hypothetical protein
VNTFVYIIELNQTQTQAMQSQSDFFSMGFSKHVYDNAGAVMSPVPPRYTSAESVSGVSAHASKVKYNFFPDQSLRPPEFKGTNIFPYNQSSMTKAADGAPARRGEQFTFLQS